MSAEYQVTKTPVKYQQHTRELISTPAKDVTIIGGSCIKYHFCRDIHVFVSTKHVFCRDKHVYICHDKIMVVVSKLLSRQIYTCLSRQTFCREKHTFFATKRRVLSRQTRVYLSRQNHVCRFKTFVATNIHVFVATKVLSRETYLFRDLKTCFVATNTYFCRDRSFVATSILLS